MPVNLSKGGNISLTKHAPAMVRAAVGLGWDARSTDGAEFDLDASAILIDANGKALSDNHFVFFNNPTDPSGAVAYQGDNRTGEGDGDDEQIFVDLSLVPAECDRIVFVVSIYEAEARNQNFGQVSNAYIRVFNQDDPLTEEIRFDLGEEASLERSFTFAELYRYNTEWKFRAIAQGYSAGLAGVIAEYGLSAG